MPNTEQRPEDWPMQLYHGDTWPAYSFTIVDESAAPITGFSVKSEVRDLDGNLIKTMIGGSGFVIAGSLVTYRTTVDLPPGEYVSDVQITLSNGEIHTQYAQSITVTDDVTN